MTAENLIDLKIFDKNKIHVLRDPVINCNEITEKKKIELDEEYLNKDYYLSIGRLTDQKNFNFLIKVFSENYKKFRIKKLVIVGDGENQTDLKEMIKNYKMENNIFLIGFRKNVYKYLQNCVALISVANYEDPGFTLIEAAYLKKKIITSLVKNGPIEMKKNGDMCYFFEPGNEADFINKILASEKDINYNLKITNAQRFSKKFTTFSHYKSFEKLLN